MQGQRFGRLVVIETAQRGGRWRVRCDCGQERLVEPFNLRSGNTRSCGCLQREESKARFSTHGFTRDRKLPPEYRLWQAMKDRCHNPKSRDYPYYGGRGIVVCDRWRTDFAAFFADVGPRPEAKLTLDRLDNEGPYAPGNVRWATRAEQTRNKRAWGTVTHRRRRQTSLRLTSN